ncbi:UDP-N-acetylmuramoylalanyl-D-glutamate--2,6-diaminopimelate ligase [Treponema primitia ZAS-2]|uniref:UDP-N-acetylmuramyl-tripeptide synthetase n=1 Tax=Treponema primitia (strain ATCC BAA-887 / DSM 12427 / ZAS-2) TaxID=545694 RepID=F5YHD8_TREPZ|nr:UDP-N-acetylmuramoyl-L-alanyl-D-glutamate--2,6-diaminopimelate ligase [Treponema primitia]AEF84744.1 UDP-N-acetylmuramoylalanyl-D-glutamate--2,6-diaminopimelate ligase [Treponema primitia ZAS-2]
MERCLSDFFTDGISWQAELLEKNGREDPLITGLEYDSRKVKPGNLFFALPGLHTDGHRFIPDAIQRGAAAILYQDELTEFQDGVLYLRARNSRAAMSPVASSFYNNPSKQLTIIGVTGTEGKSTTVYLIYQFLLLAGKKAGFVSTVQYSDGTGELWNPEHQTTPEAITIHRLLADMVANGAEYAVIEASSHGLSPKTNRLGDVAFDVSVMTNVTHEHLEFHGTWEQYRDDKANLFRTLDHYDHLKGVHLQKTEALPPSFGVANADDPSVGYFASATLHKTYTYSTRGKDADISLRSVESAVNGNWYEALIRETGEVVDIRDRLPGAFNAGNVLASLLVVSGLLFVPVKDLIPLVTKLKPVRGRMTKVQRGQPFEVLVDYAHTPSSFETIFPPLRERIDRTGGRIISLFGSAGERDTKKRPEQGRIAADWSDLVFLTDEDPRGEVPLTILEEIALGCPEGKRGENLFLIPDRSQAIRKAFSLAESGDLVLLLGKGHENSIIYATETIAYDEIAEAEKALGEMGFTGTN